MNKNSIHIGGVYDALHLRREVVAFQDRWAPGSTDGEPAPSFTWEQLERQLTDLAGPDKAGFIGPMVSATRKLARWKPPEMVLREILLLASTALDDGFAPQFQTPGDA